MSYSFPVIITQVDNVVVAEVPDLGFITNGLDYEQAIDMAQKAIKHKVDTASSAQKLLPIFMVKRKSVFYDKSKSRIETIVLDD